MLKKIDELGRIVIPAPFRNELGVELNELVELKNEGNKITISKVDKVMSKEEIEHVLKSVKEMGVDTDYYKGFADALSLTLGKEVVRNEDR